VARLDVDLGYTGEGTAGGARTFTK
jgi:hypothetical protein